MYYEHVILPITIIISLDVDKHLRLIIIYKQISVFFGIPRLTRNLIKNGRNNRLLPCNPLSMDSISNEL